jgi:preprotein translocase subunit SecA
MSLYESLLPKFEAECKADGDKVRDLGGLYVLGSERHESRRIDNQLRGRAGRQGDPGESRFYLSLEDDLMRLFATGAMNYVMGKALPDDVPIESKMVTKAVQRAQTTVEARNAEIRKDVLKYDEVMNEQRKVIYARRLQIVDGEDLRERTLELIEDATADAVGSFCAAEFPEDWDIEGLLREVASYYPSSLTVEELRSATAPEQLEESLLTEAVAYYEEREQRIGSDTMRELERRSMLQIIDQHWVEHLSEMDYLREGIYLRQMGQKDPLVEWQREGFEMFETMMSSIDDDFVKYVMHVEVVVQQEEGPDLSQASFQAPEDPVQSPRAQGNGAGAAVPRPDQGGGPAPDGGVPDGRGPQGPPPGAPPAQSPIIRSDQEKIGRNQPCWCGSGKKYKLCHGR